VRCATNIACRGIPEADDTIGVEPSCVRSIASSRPCKRQSPRQDRSSGSCELGDADRRWESKPRSRTPRFIPGSPPFRQLLLGRWVTPTKINRGGCAACETTRGPERQRWKSSPIRGSKPAKGSWKNRERRRARHLKEGGACLQAFARQGRASPPRVAEHRADRDRDGA